MSNPLSLIPAAELQAWEDDLVTAEELAAAGLAFAGFQCLDAGLAMAEAMPADIWKEHLVSLYRSTLAQFRRQHGMLESGEWEA